MATKTIYLTCDDTDSVDVLTGYWFDSDSGVCVVLCGTTEGPESYVQAWFTGGHHCSPGAWYPVCYNSGTGLYWVVLDDDTCCDTCYEYCGASTLGITSITVTFPSDHSSCGTACCDGTSCNSRSMTFTNITYMTDTGPEPYWMCYVSGTYTDGGASQSSVNLLFCYRDSSSPPPHPEFSLRVAADCYFDDTPESWCMVVGHWEDSYGVATPTGSVTDECGTVISWS